jgi:hypothetical protein
VKEVRPLDVDGNVKKNNMADLRKKMGFGPRAEKGSDDQSFEMAKSRYEMGVYKNDPTEMSALPMQKMKSSALKKISAACKAAAKRKFKVWPSAYASGWGVRCTKAGGPSKFGGGKKKK